MLLATLLLLCLQSSYYAVLFWECKKLCGLCNLLLSSYISTSKGLKDASHVSNHDGLYSESAVSCGSLPFGFNICWMRAFGSISISSVFYLVHVLN